MNKVAIVIGHTETQPGACSPYLPCEWDYNRGIANSLLNEESIDIYLYPNIIGYKARVGALAELINKTEYKAVLELHYNSAHPDANGTEALYYYNSKHGRFYADIFCEGITTLFNTKNRGSKGLYKDDQRGFYFLKKIKAPAIILEPFFGSNLEDCNSIDDNQYAKYLKYYIKHFILK